MQRLLHVDASGGRHVDVDPSEVAARLGDGWVWLDLTDPTADELRAVSHLFSLDRMTREDLGDELQFPKVDDVGDYVVAVTHGLAADTSRLRTIELDMVLGAGWLLTVHAEPLIGVDHVRDRAANPRFVLDGPDHLLTRIVEFSSERFLPLLDELDAQILDLEDRAIEGDPAVLADVQLLRREVSVLRRVLSPQQTALSKLHRLDELGVRAQREVSDAIDHHVRLVESLDAAHGLLATVLDTYRGAAAERMNEVMKVLTVFSAIVLPLSLIAGIYGMNFQNMPELRQPWAYGATLGVMAAVAVGLWLYFVRRKFIGGPSIRNVVVARRGAARLGRGMASMAAMPVRTVGRVSRVVRSTVPTDED